MDLSVVTTIALVLPLFAAGCAPTIDHHPGVVASGEHCDEEVGGSCAEATLVSEGGELEAVVEAWGYDRGAVEWDSEVLLFLAATDSSNCKVEVQDVVVDRAVVEVTTGTFKVERFQDDCVADAISRSFVITLGTAEPVSSVVVNGDPVLVVSP